MGAFSIWHVLILAVVVFLLFGRGKISDLMGDVAKGIKNFRRACRTDDEEPPQGDRFRAPRAPEHQDQDEGQGRATSRKALPCSISAGASFLSLLVVALVVVGPKDLPRLMRTVGRWVGKARAHGRSVPQELRRDGPREPSSTICARRSMRSGAQQPADRSARRAQPLHPAAGRPDSGRSRTIAVDRSGGGHGAKRAAKHRRRDPKARPLPPGSEPPRAMTDRTETTKPPSRRPRRRCSII